MNSMSDFLFPMPTAMEGAGRILDLADTMTCYNTSSSPEEADRTAMSIDWAAVGADLHQSVSTFAANHPLPADVQDR